MTKTAGNSARLLLLLMLLCALSQSGSALGTYRVHSEDSSEGSLLFGPAQMMRHWLAATRWLVGGSCTPGTKLTHPAAMAICQAAGIEIRSSTGRIGCRDPGCTSLEQVRCNTVLGIVAFARASGCPGVVITAGTEMGHHDGTYSHYNGYKLDIALTPCITGYVQANFRYSHTRGDGAKVYVDGRSNEYALEGNHWDILYK